jgi:nitrogen fixation NifU-like protein
MQDMYQERILQHYRAPKNFGTMPEPTMAAEESNPLCGDHIRIELKLDEAKTTLEDIKFSGDGCAISMASASLMTVQLRGKPMEEVRRLTQDDVIKLLAIPLSPVRIKCALTGFSALGQALHGGAATRPAAATA